MSEWISVKDRLPEPFKDCLVYDDLGIGGGSWYPIGGWILWGSDEDNAPVTHWMSLPEPPEAE